MVTTAVVGRCLHIRGFQYILVGMVMCTWTTKAMLSELCRGEKVKQEAISRNNSVKILSNHYIR